MDSIDIGGRRYISSKRAAEITGYAKDYVGQLARGEKVLATRVGRAWYVDEIAIKEHAGVAVEGQKEQGVEKASDIQNETAVGKIAHSSTDKPTVPLYSVHMRGSTRKPLLNTWSDIKYLEDNSDLLPVLRSKPTSSDDESSHIPVRLVAPLPMVNNTLVLKNEGVKLQQKKIIDNSSVRTAYIQSRLAEKSKKTYSFKEESLLFAGVFAVVVLGIFISGSVYLPSEWSFNAGDKILIASPAASGADFNIIFEYFGVILEEGINLISDFLNLLLSSLNTLFEVGLDFLLSFFN